MIVWAARFPRYRNTLPRVLPGQLDGTDTSVMQGVDGVAWRRDLKSGAPASSDQQRLVPPTAPHPTNGA